MKKLVSLLVILAGLRVAAAELKTDIEYGSAAGVSLKLDAYVPDGAGPFPAVILVHGGGWTGGDKSGGAKKNAYMAPLHEALSGAGFAWFTVNYRLAPAHIFPACIEDVEAAIRWVKAHAKDYRVDPKRIALSGESAGGHLVALAAMRADASTRLAAIVPFYGRFDLTTVGQPGETLGGNIAALVGRKTIDADAMALLRAASPLLAVKRGLPPMLLVHGTGDKTVPFEQSTQLLARLKAVGSPAELLTITDGAHGMINWDNVAPNYKRDVIAWLVKTMRVEAKK
jgi:alpha-L-fucosidase 2